MNFPSSVNIKGWNAKGDSMSDQKQQQAPIAEKEEHKEGEDDASEREDMQVKISTTTSTNSSQENAIEPVVIEDTITVDKFDVTSKEEDNLVSRKLLSSLVEAPREL